MPFFGIPIRNGLPIGLGSVAGFGISLQFSPAELFSNGEQGVWYDPSDYTTLFQDSTGVTPVTAVEQPVGLMLDKSKGLVLGSELVTNGTFDTDSDWTKGTGWTISGGKANAGNAYTGLYQGLSLSANSTYVITFTLSNYVGGICRPAFRVGSAGAIQTLNKDFTANGTYTLYATNTLSGAGIYFDGRDVANGFSLDNISVRELPGNHAYQATSASRPTLRARYNLLTYTEQFDNTSVWTPTNSSVTADQTTAPDGTITADLYASNATNGGHYVFRNSSALISVTSGVNYTFSVYLKKGTGATAPDIMQLAFSSSQFPTGYANFNLSTEAVGTTSAVTASIVPVGNGWYRCIISATATTTANSVTGGVAFTNNSDSAGRLPSYADATTSNVFIWGAQLIVTNSLPSNNYQRVAAATDYDSAGFLPYLSFDGTDDSMLTNSIDFSAGATNAPLGSELVTNGTFDSDATGATPNTWQTNNANASLIKQADGTALFSSASFAYAQLKPANYLSLTAGKFYAVSFDISDITGTLANIHVGIGTSGNIIAGSGHYSYVYLATTTTTYDFQIRPNSGGTGSFKIDNISVKELLDPALAPDKMTVWAGVRKLSDAALSMLVENSTNGETSNGAFLLYAPGPTPATRKYTFTSRGTALAVVHVTNAAFTAPITNVVTGIGDISGDIATLHINAVQAATSSDDQGSGNYGNYPLYIGRRAGTSLPFNGWLTSLIVRGAQSTDAQIEATESWVNGKTGAF